MSRRTELQFSKSRIKRAGKTLRKFHVGEFQLADHDVAEAIDVLEHWRACHSYPLTKATMGLRTRVQTEDCHDALVSQRLKRRPTIIDKLTREPRMQLTTMHDIAGCRAVLGTVDEVQRVARRWRRRKGRVLRTYDYLSTPKPSGYRGIHLVVQYDGYPVEVQLRTQFQHAWGISIERVGPLIGHDLKSGHGPDEVLHLYRVFGDLLAAAEGLPVEDVGWQDLIEAADAVGPETLSLVGLRVSNTDVEIDMPPLKRG